MSTFGRNGSITLTQNGGQLLRGRSVSYKTFPAPYPLKGTTDIHTGKTNTLFVPTETLIWKVTIDGSMPDSSWELLNDENFLEGYSNARIHQRLFPAGGYIIDNSNSLFLFNATDTGKNFNIIDDLSSHQDIF